MEITVNVNEAMKLATKASAHVHLSYTKQKRGLAKTIGPNPRPPHFTEHLTSRKKGLAQVTMTMVCFFILFFFLAELELVMDK